MFVGAVYVSLIHSLYIILILSRCSFSRPGQQHSRPREAHHHSATLRRQHVQKAAWTHRQHGRCTMKVRRCCNRYIQWSRALKTACVIFGRFLRGLYEWGEQRKEGLNQKEYFGTKHLFCVLEYVARLLFILYTRYQQLVSEINAFVSKMDNSIKHTIFA